MHALAGRVIAVEGLDGAGKSTVIATLAARLREAGCSVVLPRIGKDPTSRPARMIRELARDRANLDLTPRAELALYCAREAQILAEQVRPAMARGATVLLDRSLLTPVVLGSYGRGLPRDECERVAQAVSGGIEPDVTLIVDVHPRTSRIRKRLARARKPGPRDPSRKGLAGSALKERQWRGYRELAAERGYLLFHTERVGPSALAERVATALVSGARPSDLESPQDGTPYWQVDPQWSLEDALEHIPRELALYMTRGLVMGRALRRAALEAEPRLVAWALDADDPLRSVLADRTPQRVLADLTRQPLGDDDPRLRLAAEEPAAVARALRHVEGARADQLREQLAPHAPGEVVESLCGREDAFANELRARWWASATVSQAATSLVRCGGEAAWTLRHELFERDPAMALRSLRGVEDDAARAMLTRYADRAPRMVLRALTGNGSAFAHQLRRQLQGTGREVIDSLGPLDDDASMDLREDHAARWPSTVLGSLARLPPGPRVTALVERCEHHGAGDLHVLRQRAARAESMSQSPRGAPFESRATED